MDGYWLLIPYVLVIPINGIRLYLLEKSLPKLLNTYNMTKLRRLKAMNKSWYFWLLRDVKDWIIMGLIWGACINWIADPVPWAIPTLLTLLSILLLSFVLVSSILLLYLAGYRIPSILISIATRLSLPDYVPSNRKRVGLWGLILLFAGAMGMFSWSNGSNMAPLLWSLLTLTLGFFSLLKAIFPGQVETAEVGIDVKNAS